MATQNPAVATPPVSSEVLRERLLQPFPRITLRSIIILLVVLAVLVWSWSASRPSEINRVSGIFDALGAMGNLVTRMVPPTFNLAHSTEVTYHVLGADITLGWLIVVTAVIETIQMAIIGTVAAVILSLPPSLLVARNVSPYPICSELYALRPRTRLRAAVCRCRWTGAVHRRAGAGVQFYRLVDPFICRSDYRNGPQVLGYMGYAQGFGQTSGGNQNAFRQGYAAATSIILFLLVLVVGLSA